MYLDTLVVRFYWGALSAKFGSPHLVVWSHGQSFVFLVQELVDPAASGMFPVGWYELVYGYGLGLCPGLPGGLF